MLYINKVISAEYTYSNTGKFIVFVTASTSHQGVELALYEKVSESVDGGWYFKPPIDLPWAWQLGLRADIDDVKGNETSNLSGSVLQCPEVFVRSPHSRRIVSHFFWCRCQHEHCGKRILFSLHILESIVQNKTSNIFLQYAFHMPNAVILYSIIYYNKIYLISYWV